MDAALAACGDGTGGRRLFTRTRTESLGEAARKSFPAACTQLLPDFDDHLPQPSQPEQSVDIERVRKSSGKNVEDSYY